MPPIFLELTASPIQPQVMAKPIAAPVTAGNISPTTASVVGKTGAIEMPAMATSARATPVFATIAGAYPQLIGSLLVPCRRGLGSVYLDTEPRLAPCRYLARHHATA